jgi:hypothetical protein
MTKQDDLVAFFMDDDVEAGNRIPAHLLSARFIFPSNKTRANGRDVLQLSEAKASRLAALSGGNLGTKVSPKLPNLELSPGDYWVSLAYSSLDKLLSELEEFERTEGYAPPPLNIEMSFLQFLRMLPDTESGIAIISDDHHFILHPWVLLHYYVRCSQVGEILVPVDIDPRQIESCRRLDHGLALDDVEIIQSELSSDNWFDTSALYGVDPQLIGFTNYEKPVPTVHVKSKVPMNPAIYRTRIANMQFALRGIAPVMALVVDAPITHSYLPDFTTRGIDISGLGRQLK